MFNRQHKQNELWNETFGVYRFYFVNDFEQTFYNNREHFRFHEKQIEAQALPGSLTSAVVVDCNYELPIGLLQYITASS